VPDTTEHEEDAESEEGKQEEQQEGDSDDDKPLVPAKPGPAPPEPQAGQQELPLAVRRIHQKLRDPVKLMKLHLKHYLHDAKSIQETNFSIQLPEEIHRLHQETSERCDGCNEGAPAPSRSRVTGLRADSFGHLIFVDHAKVRHNDELYLLLLILDGATNLLTARVVESEAAEVTLEAFREWMDNFQCCPKALASDMAFQHPDFQKNYRCHGIKSTATGPRTLWPNRAETAVRLFKRQLALMIEYLAEESFLPNPTFKNLVQKCCWAKKQPAHHWRKNIT